MSDLIERQDALDAIDKAFERSNQLNAYIRAFMMNAISEVKKLPPAQPMTELEAYYKGKIDGIIECTERLKKLKISLQKGETDE